ncbi:hypothetical protein [Micromonospora sp. NPDC049497]|uniref:hypothetical protein n=1 Tax=Micromonospora sp. NPDC049497 TaxID=3364273 RepID=UPI0037A47775
MKSFDERLADGLHGIVDGDLDSSPPLGALLERGRRARRRRTSAIVSGTLAVLALGAIGTATLVQPSTPDRSGVTVAAPEVVSSRMELASATEASASISYKVKVTARSAADASTAQVTEGAFDPRTDTGQLSSPSPGAGVVYLERLVDGVRFVSSSGSKDVWKQYPGRHDRLAYHRALSGAVGASADPEQLFDALRQDGAKVTRVGPDVYHFTSTTSVDNRYGTETVTFVGDVTLDADKRIAKVSYELTRKGQFRPGVKGGLAYGGTDVVTVELSEYGTPVQVDRPAKVVVVK